MKTKWAAFAAILFVGVSSTLTAGDPAKSNDLAALEKEKKLEFRGHHI